ncbi:MAG: histidine--tRNA ligase [Brevinemataceae bacterium]
MSTKLSTNSYPGTRDFYPKEMRFRKQMFHLIEETLEYFAYEKISGPLLESFEIYAAKSGEEIAERQLYVFTDKGDRKVAVRPELTPTIARMFAAKKNDLAPIQRWYSIENFMRYERPQKGRLREFVQINVDLIGVKGVSADFEILKTAKGIFDVFGANSEMYEIRINHRGFISDVLRDYLGVSDENQEIVMKILDKKDKLEKEKFVELLLTSGITKVQIEKLLTVLGQDLDQNIELVPNSIVAQELKQVLELGKEIFGKNNPLKFDFSVVRGLAYYTGLVFEAYDKDPANIRALFGGGRYDSLLGLFSKGEDVPGIGFAIGDVTFELFLKNHGLLNNSDLIVEKHMIAVDKGVSLVLFHRVFNQLKKMQNMFVKEIYMLESLIGTSESNADSRNSLEKIVGMIEKNAFFDIEKFNNIREKQWLNSVILEKDKQILIEIYPDISKPLGKQLSYADKAHINYVWICGEPELIRGIVKRKNMFTGREEEFDLKTLELY